MYTVIGKVETRFTPVPGRVHPSESSFLHRTGKAVKDSAGRIIGREGECVRKSRKTVCGLRDKMACASSSAKVARFVNANGRVDRVLDRPVPVSIGHHTAKPRRGVKAVAPCRRVD